MPVLCFPEPDALRRALATGVVPLAITRGAASAGRDAQGRIWLRPEVPLSRDLVTMLTRFGVRVLGSSASEMLQPISCWQQLIPLTPYVGPTPRPLMLEIPISEMPQIIGQLRRFAPQRIGFRWVEPDAEMGWLLVERLPEFLLGRLHDRLTPVRIFHEQVPDVWVPLNQAHPLANQLSPPDDAVLVLERSDRWRTIPRGPFLPATSDPLPLPARKPPLRDHPAPLRMQHPLRLIPTTATSSPEFWVIDCADQHHLHAMADSMEEWTLSRLNFAWSARPDGGWRLLLRLRVPRQPLVWLPESGQGFTGLLKLPNVFVPSGMRLTPILRRDVIRSLLGVDQVRTIWLMPTTEGGFRIESIPTQAFQPILSHVRYSLPPVRSHAISESGTAFLDDLPFFQRVEQPATRSRWSPATAPQTAVTTESGRVTLPESPAPAIPPAPPRFWERFARMFSRLTTPPAIGDRSTNQPADRQSESELPPPTLTESISTFVSRKKTDSGSVEAFVEPDRLSDLASRRQLLETRFLESLEQFDPQKMLEFWPELAAMYGRSNLAGDSAVCWLNALWEQSQLTHLWAWGWLQAESRQVRGVVERDARTRGRNLAETPSIRTWMEAVPNPARARSIAAYLVWISLIESQPDELSELLPAIQRYLDQHENWLPIRAVWLTRMAMMRLTRGDLLSLARTRDRLMHRLKKHGFSLDLDVPSFLRFASRGVSDRYTDVRDWMMRIREPIRRWIHETSQPRATGANPELPNHASHLQRFGLDPDLHATRAFTDLILAWGLARLGEHNACNALRQQARQLLHKDDRVHSLLYFAFDFRIQQVQEGKTNSGPLPMDLLHRILELPDEERYKVDKLREHSRILEPVERIDAYRAAMTRHYADPTPMLATLRHLPDTLDSQTLTDNATQLLDRCHSPESAAVLPQVLQAILELLPRISEGLALRALRLVESAVERLDGSATLQIRLLERAISAAIAMGQSGRLPEFNRHLLRLFRYPRRDLETEEFQALNWLMLRSLRRTAQLAECERLMQTLEPWITRNLPLPQLRQQSGDLWPITLRSLLVLTTGWFAQKQDDAAMQVLDLTRELLLLNQSLEGLDQTWLAIHYVTALSQAPIRVALGRLDDLFQRLRNTQLIGTTNTHYTLPTLMFVETVVRSIVNEDFNLGPTVRRWLDEDEYRVRRRMDRDVWAAIREFDLRETTSESPLGN
ncbi:hypothetical protein [Tuwongella immobilis]|uniref:FtsH ternary system domain-containing protein n=1 Tax=Tuwongella immobilis TaxID=692036 RepID=A0A6C2YKT1_9BACT|nr:hypothetical protein [Tuwongella immobilis]VIP01984.1 Uncharacterized protein OS=Myxococcus stipitatus (strain DSM 14675 / JCM 12634 / Mx s8) GN=MYSTI_03368 PE=4 SV=1 [Tuwongella immobilis]VTS00039.1 Uncharacterized protein OS=Myxococcus stipitatus (strain DSM 14675 / JCM 12634 / Mx s8) GN=MYSTI_03368 PE=4 SV=1 [Tuwongella immobilis]